MFNAETGTSVGEIMGQSKSLNSVDMRPSRPFKIVTASEDTTLAFFEGPPFKFKFTMNVSYANMMTISFLIIFILLYDGYITSCLCSKDHQRFVNVVRYAPNGEVFISGGADGKVCRLFSLDPCLLFWICVFYSILSILFVVIYL